MQQRTSLLLDLFPRDSFYLAGLNLMQTAHDLLLPGGIRVLINGCVQTGDQISSQFRPFVLRQGKGLLQQLMGFLGHVQNYMPRCNLVNITGGGRVAATTDSSLPTSTSADPVCTVTSDEPPRPLPRTDSCPWRTSLRNLLVTGCST